MNDIQIFNNPEFGEIRTVMIGGEPWFVGRDIALKLGYAKPQNAIKDNVDEGDARKQGVPDSNNHIQQMVVVNEAGMYSLIFGSKLESAKKFKKWVTSEVLPSIRRTGSYGRSQLPMSTQDQIKLLAQGNVEVNKRVDTLEQRFDKLEADMPVFSIDTKRIQQVVRKRAIEILGGKHSNAYKDKSTRTYVFADIQCMLRRNFDVKRYEEIKHQRTGDAIRLVREHKPPLVLKDRVDMMNAQKTLNL